MVITGPGRGLKKGREEIRGLLYKLDGVGPFVVDQSDAISTINTFCCASKQIMCLRANFAGPLGKFCVSRQISSREVPCSQENFVQEEDYSI